MALARNLRALLKLFDISQEGFAKSLGVDSATVSRWMNDGSSIRQANVTLICTVFDLEPDDILSERYGLEAQLMQREFGIYPHSVPVLSPDEAAAATDAAERAREKAKAKAESADREGTGGGARTGDWSGCEGRPTAPGRPAKRRTLRRRPPIDIDLARAATSVESVWVDIEWVDIPQSVAEKYPGAFAVEVDNPAADEETPRTFHAIVDPERRPEGASLVVVELSGEGRPRIRRWSACAEGDLDDGVKIIGRVVWFQATGML